MSDNQNTPFCQLGGFEQKMLLLDVARNAYYLKNRQIPANLDQMCDTLKGDILKYMPKVTERAIRDGVESYILHEETQALSVAVLFKAIRSKYSQPFEPRNCDIDPYRRPDLEQDSINLLDTLAEQIANNRQPYANWRREYAYLVMRGQIAWDAFEAELDKARQIINTDRVNDYRRPLTEFIGQDKDDLHGMAKKLAVITWLNGCISQDRMPSDYLTPLINEQQYAQFRKTI